MRADRLVATLLLLQARGRVTAAEARALFAAAGPLAMPNAVATSRPELGAALRKLVRALPPPFREGAQAAGSAVAVDHAPWATDAQVRHVPASVSALQDAVVDGLQVRICYRDRAGAATTRAVSPLGLVAKSGTWYLLAGTPTGRRTFRVDRITDVRVTGERAERPEGFDLGQAWQEVVAAVDDLRATARARAVADATALGALRWVFGTELHVGAPLSDGRVELVVTGSSPQMLARRLAGFGALVQVLEPGEVRRHLARLGHELVVAYAEGDDGRGPVGAGPDVGRAVSPP